MAFFQEQPNFRASAPREAIKPGEYRGPKSDRRFNAYAGKCVRCHGWVEAQAGWLTGSRQTGWGVEHKDGECVTEQQPTVDPTTDRTGAAPTTEFKVPDGRYTIVWGDHHKTIRVRHQGEYDDFKPGQVVLSHLTGSNNDSDYTSFAHVDERGEVRIWKKFQGVENLREAVKVLLGDPKAASQAYAQESGCCGVCGRTLTTPESLAAGIGPECAKRVSW